MTPCPDHERLLDLAAATPDPLTLVDHVASCPTCREALAEMAALRAVLAAEEAVREGFSDVVVASLTPGAAEDVAPHLPTDRAPLPGAPSGRPARSPGWAAATAVLAGAAGFFLTAAAGATGAAGASSPLLAVTIASAAALLLPRWAER